jgi:cobyrinic acid a,c-diamide synthase
MRLDKLWNLANRSALPGVSPLLSIDCRPTRRLQVAVAYDEGFSCHFPDTLDQLEALGATIRDFSPLRNESLPDKTDLVYFGCGHIEQHLETLASNHCLKQALRCFAASGGRIYAEGSGLAYLCRQIVLADGQTANMAGLLPATARQTEEGDAEPMEIAFGASCWLADARTKMRGYRTGGWQIEPTGAMLSYARNPQCRCDVVGRGNVLGSRISVNFAAQPHLLRRFFSPYVPVSRALQL